MTGMNLVSSKPVVFKRRSPFGCAHCRPVLEKPWTAIHPAGNRSFDTWREAYDYARTPMVLMNS